VPFLAGKRASDGDGSERGIHAEEQASWQAECTPLPRLTKDR
jgi:hypothetical protein